MFILSNIMKKRCAFDTPRSLEIAVPNKERLLPAESFICTALFIHVQPVILFKISRIEGIALVWRLFSIASM